MMEEEEISSIMAFDRYSGFNGSYDDYESSDLESENQDVITPLHSDRQSSGIRQRPCIGHTFTSEGDIDRLASFETPKGKRSTAIDLETGKPGGARSQCAFVREEDEEHPQSRRNRGFKKLVKRILEPFRKKQSLIRNSRRMHKRPSLISQRSLTVPVGDNTQYTIMSIDEDEKGLSAIYDDHAETACFCGLNPNKMVMRSLFRAFRSSFSAVLVSASISFGILILSFSLALFALGHLNPNCMAVAGEDFSGQFMDAFSLSWTTFTTVGYGAVFPGTSTTADNINHCWAITIVSTVEAFVGILFASFWGAIFLSKVSRVSSVAQVVFSDALVVRYGEGVEGTIIANECSDEDDDLGDTSNNSFQNHASRSQKSLPCPVLEFRIINKLAAQKKGEIIDASLNIVASVNKSQIPSHNGHASRKKRRGKKRKGEKSGGKGLRVMDGYEKPSAEAMRRASQKIENILAMSKLDVSRCDDQDPNAANTKDFAKLYIESTNHPFFKRIWVAKHTLDQESPLLCNDAKDLIRINGGHWPGALDNCAAVRASVKFDQILVSLSGTSNADANSVYSQKIYDYKNLVVGYKFCNILYRETDGSLGVDEKLLNDVLEQTGGGGESLVHRTVDFRSSKEDILM